MVGDRRSVKENDVRVAKPEVVADFVDQDVGDQLFQGDIAALGPFVEDRAAVQEDPRGLRLGAEGGAIRQADAGVEAGQLEGVLDPHLVEDFLGGEVVDAEHHVAGQPAEPLGQGREGVLGDLGQVFERGRVAFQGVIPIHWLIHRA